MGRSQALRVLLCGCIAGVLWSLLTSAALLVIGSDFLAAVQTSARYPRADGAVFFAIDLLMGVWAVWLYAAIAPKHGSRLRAATVAGSSWWMLKTLQSAKWVGLGFLPVEVAVAPTIVTLATAIVASVVGAQIYDRVTGAPQNVEASG